MEIPNAWKGWQNGEQAYALQGQSNYEGGARAKEKSGGLVSMLRIW